MLNLLTSLKMVESLVKKKTENKKKIAHFDI
jgi:hypothetical protein